MESVTSSLERRPSSCRDVGNADDAVVAKIKARREGSIDLTR